jgi:hypothetical protein
MTDRPVIFSAPMVLALLAGRKTMTRRLAWKFSDVNDNHTKSPSPWQRVQTGDRLWVKETFVCYHTKEKVYLRGPKIDVEWVYYRASDGHAFVDEMKWESSMYMPRKLSRLTLIVTATKIERLQEISPDDAWNEGVERRSRSVRQMSLFGATAEERQAIYKRACVWEFEELWKSLHGPDAWDENPEVVALSFTVHKQNIDALAEAA